MYTRHVYYVRMVGEVRRRGKAWLTRCNGLKGLYGGRYIENVREFLGVRGRAGVSPLIAHLLVQPTINLTFIVYVFVDYSEIYITLHLTNEYELRSFSFFSHCFFRTLYLISICFL